MKIIYSSNNKPISLGIKVFTASIWHHCGVVIGDFVYEATAFKGVIKSSLAEFKSRGKWAIVDAPTINVDLDWLEAQLGKRYDWGGILSLILRDRKWQRADRWYCSELVARLAEVSGSPIVRSNLKGVTPRDLWVLPLKVVESGGR